MLKEIKYFSVPRVSYFFHVDIKLDVRLSRATSDIRARIVIERVNSAVIVPIIGTIDPRESALAPKTPDSTGGGGSSGR